MKYEYCIEDLCYSSSFELEAGDSDAELAAIAVKEACHEIEMHDGDVHDVSIWTDGWISLIGTFKVEVEVNVVCHVRAGKEQP